MSLSNIEPKNKFSLAAIIISFLPITFFLGSGLVNFFVILLDILFIIEIIKNKNFKYLNNIYFFLLIIFWTALIINLIFSISFHNSLPRTIGFLRFIFLPFAINYFLFDRKENYSDFILKIWTVVFLIISFDLIYEYVFGSNILGFKSYMPGRLSGFFNQELKIGHLYSAFILISSSYIFEKLKKLKFNKNYYFEFLHSNLIYLFIILFLFVSFVIGERSNFIKTLLISSIFIIFFENKNFSKKIISLLIGFIIFFSIILSNENYKYRFWNSFFGPLLDNPVEYISNSNYGTHYKVGIEVFKNNKFFGVGLKNYREEITKDYYDKNASIHPHQIHIELLSEIGIFGYSIFIILFFLSLKNAITNFLIKKNNYKLAGILFVLVSLMPIIPSGSFFTTYGATLFWINFGFLIKKD
tara:strand:+ start:7295 stop:8533 length:1239 start_codon:yes stop_codon:yes gene_type:complete